ncbi:hypothetical protein HGRIS_001621 [Hohenbuehelia grisea]|uniref:Uncharacterized protein n=1 Tax=Hohenbuehelia grisea TaxID=104357 RepID=A0ABR3JIB5_9AGAR
MDPKFHHYRNTYTRCPAAVKIDDLAKQRLRYVIIRDEEAAFITSETARRDAVWAELGGTRATASVSGTLSTLPPVDSTNSSSYLDGISSLLMKDVPELTYEDHVVRYYYAIWGLELFDKYRLGFVLDDLPEIQAEAVARAKQVEDEWSSSVESLGINGAKAQLGIARLNFSSSSDSDLGSDSDSGWTDLDMSPGPDNILHPADFVKLLLNPESLVNNQFMQMLSSDDPCDWVEYTVLELKRGPTGLSVEIEFCRFPMKSSLTTCQHSSCC